jgi:hypothetical protein
MSSAEPGGADASGGKPAATTLWQRIKAALVRTENEFAFVKGLTIVSIVGTLIAAYFQNLSSYQDKVATQAKDDLAAATQAFTEASTTLSTAIVLQGQLFYDFVHAHRRNAVADPNALTSKHATELYKSYEDAVAGLRQSTDLLGRKMEIYLDWPSDPNHDPATAAIGNDPITTSLLGTVGFDCDDDMPSFASGKTRITKSANGASLAIDWYSAKHHLFTIAYCFDVTQKTWMEIVRKWSSQSTLDQGDVDKFFTAGGATGQVPPTASQLQLRLDHEVIRLNAFMSRTMNEIEQIRVRYRPNGYFCTVPVVGSMINFVSRELSRSGRGWCTPIPTSAL